ncbi:MAG: 1,2-dihydroxy-3-keto-5-methylthiopentene dioxygenase [Vezdaea aestivalis]|nr:MAG: 1,2-dihydroxy-3-keto-5-methylthiopentene dioxygenase [Vezdaea aestivalis]
MKAYWYDNSEVGYPTRPPLPLRAPTIESLTSKQGDQRLPHDSGRAVSPTELAKLGVFYEKLSTIEDIDTLAQQRSYKNRDEIVVSPDKMGDKYEGMVRNFFNEHLHEDEEIRWIRDGAGFFDVRSADDDWVRIRLVKDDLIVLPAGIYHRFTTDEDNYIKAMRLFKEDPKWTPLNRGSETDHNSQRREYVQMRDSRAIETLVK